MASNQLEKENEEEEQQGEKSYHPTKEMEMETNIIRYKNRNTGYLTIPSAITKQTKWMFNKDGPGKEKVRLDVDFVRRTFTVRELNK